MHIKSLPEMNNMCCAFNVMMSCSAIKRNIELFIYLSFKLRFTENEGRLVLGF